MNILFAIGMCIRLFHTDPWQAPTYKITEVGHYSYLTTQQNVLFNSDVVIKFENQNDYEKVTCPPIDETDKEN